MSLIPAGTTVFEAFAQSLLPLVFFRPRSIGGIVANVTIQESARDSLTVTRHPVEQGASISDHAYKEPARLTITAGWSNSSFQALGNPNYDISIYDALLALQSSREPFDVITGKRFYQNMLMRDLYQTTDERNENALIVVVELEEILLTSTETVSVPPAKDQKSPQINSATQNTGAKNLTPAPNYAPDDL